MKTVENLEGSEILLVSARKVNGGKYQLTFAQKISNPHARPASIVGLLNSSDDRFSSDSLGKPRYAWISGEAADIKSSFGIDLSDLENVGDEKELNILNPTVKGSPLNIQITETTEGTEYDVANFATRAKRAGKDGEFILSMKGEFIYVKSTVVPGEAKHIFIKDTTRDSKAADSADDAVKDALDS
jgi:hypothetical protein